VPELVVLAGKQQERRVDALDGIAACSSAASVQRSILRPLAALGRLLGLRGTHPYASAAPGETLPP